MSLAQGVLSWISSLCSCTSGGDKREDGGDTREDAGTCEPGRRGVKRAGFK